MFAAQPFASKFLALAAVLFMALPAGAQESRGSIVGRVTDPSGAVVPGATVKATNRSTNVAVTMQSNTEGSYQLLFLNPGVYSVSAEMTGFKSFQRDDIQLRINDRIEVDVVLEVGNVTERVVVSALPPLLEVANANVGQVFDNQRIGELPIAHGSVRTLFFLLGGVTLAGGGYSTAEKFQDPSRPASSSWLRINGSPVGSTEFSMDGVPNTQTANSDFGSGMSNQPPADAIQEVKLETAYDASVGHTSGTHVNMIMKSGTNKVHGTAYFFYRNPSLNANSFLGNVAGQPRADFGYERGGYSLNGPAYLPKVYNGKDRTFFAYTYEVMNDLSQGYPYVGSVPPLDQLKGDFSALLKIGTQYQIYDPATIAPAGSGRYSHQPLPGNIIPSSRLDPIALKIAQYWPKPNTTGLADGTNNYTIQNQPDPNFYQDHIFRLDHSLTDKQRLYWRFTRYYKTEGPYRDYFLNLASGNNFQARPYNIVFDDTYTVSPRLVIDVRYGYQRFPSRSWQKSAGFDLATLGFPQSVLDALSFRDPLGRTFPGVNVSGLAGLQPEGGASRTGDDVHSWFADISHPMGNHLLRFGAGLRVYRKNAYALGNATPRFNFTTAYTNGPLDNSPASPGGVGQGFAAFLLGIPSSGTVDFNDSYAIQSAYHGAYVQDDWRLTPKLTLTLGLRWEYEGPLSERYNRSVRGFDPQAALSIAAQVQNNYGAKPIPQLPASAFQVRGGLLYAGVNGQPHSLFAAATRDLMPRLGFSWNALKDTVLRGGYGVFFLDTGVTSRVGPYQLGYSQTTNIIPSLDNGVTYQATLSNPFPDGILRPSGNQKGAMTYVGQGVSFFDTNLKPPYMQRWSLSLQQLLPGRFLLDTGYVGSRSTRLRITRNMDGLPDQYLSTLPYRDQATINTLSAQVSNPFYPLLPGTSLAGQTVSVSQLLLPFPQFTGMTTTTNQGYSWYHGWQTRVERRFANSFTIQLSYTFSKLMEATTYLNAGDPMPYRTISLDDRPHHLGITGIYELPFGRGHALLTNTPRPLRQIVGGWQLAAMMNLWSGSPLGFGDMIFSGDIKNIALPGGQRTVGSWFNTDAGFERTPAKQLGSHLFQGPLYYSGVRSDRVNMWDISLLKQTPIRETVRLQIRAEALNAFNHPGFSSPNTTVTSAGFGTVTGENVFTRQIQFGCKVIF